MKKALSPIIIMLCFFIPFISCSNKTKRSKKPISTITISPSKKNYTLGDEILIQVKTNLKNGEIDEIQLFYENELIATDKSLDFNFTLKKINRLGNNSLKVVAIKTDGIKNTRYKTFSVLSDLKPDENTFEIINEYPHSSNFFTQGLLMYNDFLYESTGQKGRSGIYKIDIKTGKVLQSKELQNEYFGEGITILNDKIFQLTYKAKKGFVYNLNNFALIDSFRINSPEGWGITNDGTNLIISDGSNKLTYIDSKNYSILKTIYVADNKSYINGINELEYINGSVFANVWIKDFIIEIEPESGKIISKTDLSDLYNHFNYNKNEIDVLNGIAYNKLSNTLFVTGKLWPKLFEIKLKGIVDSDN